MFYTIDAMMGNTQAVGAGAGQLVVASSSGSSPGTDDKLPKKDYLNLTPPHVLWGGKLPFSFKEPEPSRKRKAGKSRSLRTMTDGC